MNRLRAIGTGAAIAVAATAPAPAQVVDLFGVNQATLEWTPASGSVAGYYVIVARNGGTPVLQAVSGATRATVQSSYGETLSVQVAAFDRSGLAGPLSPPSETLRFNPPTGGGDPPTDPDPGTPGDPGDPDEPTDPDDPGDPGDPTPGDDGDPGEAPPLAHTRFDFSGDGFSDLLLRHPASGELTLWKMQEAQVLESARVPHLPYPWLLEASGDLDGDGDRDLVWRNSKTGKLEVWRVRGHELEGGGALAVPGIALDTSWQVGGSADFDADGRDELVLTRPSRGAAEILSLDGTQVLTRSSRKAPGGKWRLVATPDVDGDGAAEIVWGHSENFSLSLEWLAAPQQPQPITPDPRGWRVLGSADFDGDRRDELLMQERASGRVQPWALDGADATPAAWSVKPGDKYWQYRGLGDFDADGRADSFWLHRKGTVEIWFAADGGVEAAFASESAGGHKLVGDEGD